MFFVSGLYDKAQRLQESLPREDRQKVYCEKLQRMQKEIPGHLQLLEEEEWIRKTGLTGLTYS